MATVKLQCIGVPLCRPFLYTNILAVQVHFPAICANVQLVFKPFFELTLTLIAERLIISNWFRFNVLSRRFKVN